MLNYLKYITTQSRPAWIPIAKCGESQNMSTYKRLQILWPSAFFYKNSSSIRNIINMIIKIPNPWLSSCLFCTIKMCKVCVYIHTHIYNFSLWNNYGEIKNKQKINNDRDILYTIGSNSLISALNIHCNS